MRALFTALGYLTRLPLLRGKPDGRTWGRSLMFFPLVGALVGGGLTAMASAGIAILSPVIAAFLILVLWTWLTAGRSLQGLAETIETWRMAHEPVAETPRLALGGAGASATALALLGKLVLLSELLAADAHMALWLIPVAARAAVVPLVALLHHARADGGAAEMNRHARPGGVVVALLLTAGALGWAGWSRLPILAAAFAAASALQLWLRWRHKAVSNASLGAAIEVAELAGLLCLALTSAPAY